MAIKRLLEVALIIILTLVFLLITVSKVQGQEIKFDTSLPRLEIDQKKLGLELVNNDANFKGFAISLLMGVGAEHGNGHSSNGNNYTLQLEGINLANGRGYVFGTQFQYNTQRLFIPASPPTMLPTDERIRNYEVHAFVGLADQHNNIIAIKIGTGKPDEKGYRGHTDFGLLGALNLSIVENSLYLGLQSEVGVKTNQFTQDGSSLYVRIKAGATKRF